MSRLVITATDESFVARIRVKRDEYSWLFLLWGPLWLLGWPILVLLDLAGQTPGPMNPGFLLLVTLLWLPVAAMVVYAWPWNAFGQEVVVLSDGILSLRQEVFGRGTVQRFPFAEIDGLDLDLHDETVEWSGTALDWAPDPQDLLHVWPRVLRLGGASIRFEHGVAVHGFGLGLEGEESDALLIEIRQYVIDHPTVLHRVPASQSTTNLEHAWRGA
jgi:hypothetical protein